MEKSQGATLGTVILAALLLRPGTANSPEPKATTEPGSAITASLQGKAVDGDGPWVASCEFWAPERSAPEEADSSALVVTESKNANGNPLFQAKESQEESDCRAPDESRDTKETPRDNKDDAGAVAKWGIPAGSKPTVTAIIATVPDPIRTNLAFQFDWTIDALLAAAADNG